MEHKDYYSILGVTPDTPQDDIKRAYRKLARKYHPDVSKEPDAEARFKDINEAWEVLQDPKKKSHYDKVRSGAWQPRAEGFDQSMGNDFYSGDHPEDFVYQGGGGGDFSDFFNSIFAGGGARRAHAGTQRRKGRDVHATIEIPLNVSFQGGTQNVSFQMGGQTKNLQVKIPAGVANGSQIRLKGQGGEGHNGGEAGDLYIDIHLQKHPIFSVDHKNIQLNLPMTPWEAALGATISVPTLGGQVSLKIPPNAKSDQKLRLKGRGLPGRQPGDQYVILKIETPNADNENAVKVYEEMAKAMPFNPREKWGQHYA